jgi:adenylate kinase family enzyme
VERVSVVGCSGSGKTTVAARLAERLDAPHIELDAMFHQPRWTPLPEEEFRERLDEMLAGDRWVVDGNYSAVRDLVWTRADTIVWIDLPRWRVMSQLIPRTVVRAVTRRELWNGNTEPLAGMFRWDPHRSILRWSWTTHRKVRDRYEAAMSDPDSAHLRFVRLRSRAEVRRWLAERASRT